MLHVEVLHVLRRSECRLAEVRGVRISAGLLGRVRPVRHGQVLAALNRDPTRDWPVRCELDGLERLRHPGRRAQWLTGRLCLRDLVLADDRLAAIRPLLARQKDGAAGGIGRPVILDDHRRVVAEASVSHCRDYSVALLSRSRCSVDIEPRATVGTSAAASLFGSDEHRLACAMLDMVDPDDRATVHWTLIECLGKLFGRPGFGRGRFHILPPHSDDAAGIFRFGTQEPGMEQRHRVRINTTIFSGHIISTATADAGVRPDLWGAPGNIGTPEWSRHAVPCRS